MQQYSEKPPTEPYPSYAQPHPQQQEKPPTEPYPSYPQPHPQQEHDGHQPPPYSQPGFQAPHAQQPPVIQQEQRINVQVNQQQQQTVVVRAGSYGSGALMMAIIVTIISFFCGFWPLIFSLFGVGLAIAANDARDDESGQKLSRASKGCSCGALVAIGMEWLMIIIAIATVSAGTARAVNNLT